MEKQPIGNQIYLARKAAGLTQQQLADRTSVHKDTISGLESGRKKSTSLATLQLLGKQLDVTFEI